MIQPKKKLCDGCGDLQYIWKNAGGKRLCKRCAGKNTGVAKLSIKPTTKFKPIPPRSPKRSKEERLYLAKRILFLTSHPMCIPHLSGCMGASDQVHHKRGRVGEDLLNEEFWLPVCDNCHKYIEANPSFAIELGYSIKRIT